MVSTRHHPRAFPEPELAPSRTSTPTKSSTSSPTKAKTTAISPPSSPTTALTPDTSTETSITKTPKPRGRKTAAAPSSSTTTSTLSLTGYTHTPNPLVLLWLAISLPLVFWDTLYVFLRPHSMPGGRLHSPIWTPYALYGTVDYIYGWPAWNNNNGLTAAQSALNVLESLLYLFYLVVVGGQVVDWSWEGLKGLEVRGPWVDVATLACFSSAVMTVSKTVLYFLNEYFSNFENVGHNSWFNLIVLYIIPDGAWIVVPSYLIYVLGKEILEAMQPNGKKVR